MELLCILLVEEATQIFACVKIHMREQKAKKSQETSEE